MNTKDDVKKDFEDFLEKRSSQSKKSRFSGGHVSPNYQERVVAYIDMLGISAYMKGINPSDEQDAPRRYATITEISSIFKVLCKTLGIKKIHLSKMEISDSFIISVQLANICELIGMLAELQFELLKKSPHFYCEEQS